MPWILLVWIQGGGVGGVSLPVGLPYFYEAAGVWAVLVLVCLAPLVDVVDVLGLVGFSAVVAFCFVLWCPHGIVQLFMSQSTMMTLCQCMCWCGLSTAAPHMRQAIGVVNSPLTGYWAYVSYSSVRVNFFMLSTFRSVCR